MKRTLILIPLFLLAILCASAPVAAVEGVIKIGFNLPLSGMFSMEGRHAKDAAELVRRDIEAVGGMKIGGKTYGVKFLYGDNRSNPTTASALIVEQITKARILGIIGPLSSQQAIPVGQMANSFSTPMISPWSTSPQTTKDRPFVFRAGFVIGVQGPVLTRFVRKEFNATKAAILYNVLNAYSRGMAKAFKQAFENTNGPGSVVAFEEFRTGDQNFAEQLRDIQASGAQILFTPQHYNEVPFIVRQAKQLGLDIPIIGSNSWAGGDLAAECGANCNGLFFTGNYAAGGATGINRKFVTAYHDAYGSDPDEPAALTWDATRSLLAAISGAGKLTGNLLTDRLAVKNALVQLKDFDGATGTMSYNTTGNPSKCTLIIKIANGKLTSHESICP